MPGVGGDFRDWESEEELGGGKSMPRDQGERMDVWPSLRGGVWVGEDLEMHA